MSSTADPIAYRHKLQQFLPFLNRTLAKLSDENDIAEGKKVKDLIDYISSDVKLRQLAPDTLMKIEQVCKSLYSKHGREDEGSYNNPGPSHRPNSADSSRSSMNTRQPFQVDNDETPRSPSPEESRRVSTFYVPKEIPSIDRRAPRSPLADSPPRHLRKEPVVIPIASRSSNEGLFKQDQDYRIPYENRSSNHERYEERRVLYQNDADLRSFRVAGVSEIHPSAGMPVSNLPKRERESRFDRYSAFPINTTPVLPQDDHHVHSNNRLNQWDVQLPRDHSHNNRDRNAQFSERDRQFHPAASDSRHFSNRNPQGSLHTSSATPNMASSSYSQSRWVPPVVQQSGPVQRNRLQDGTWEQPKPVSHPLSSVRNEEVSAPYPRMDQATSRYELNHATNASQSNWSNRELQGHSRSNFSYDKEPLSSGMGYRQPDPHVPPRLFPPGPLMASSISASSSNYIQPARQVANAPNYSSASQPTAPPPPTVRREDPRLANRFSKPSQTAAHIPRPPSTSSNPSLSRPSDQKESQRQSSRVPAPSESVKSSRKEVDRRKDGETNSTKSSSSKTKSDEGTAGSNNAAHSSNAFVSPLDSLYKSTSKSNQTGRGYGEQKSYKIPKRQSNESNPRKETNVRPTTTTSEEALTSDATIGLVDSTSTVVSEGVETANVNDDSHTHSKEDDDLSHIPLDVVEGCLKRAMSSNQTAAQLLDKDKVAHGNSLTSQSESGRKSRDSGSESDPSNERTVSSSGEGLIIHTSEDEEHNRVHTAAAAPEAVGVDKAAVDTLNDQDSTRPGQKKTRGRRPRASNGLPPELARLHEDLTDYMKGTVDAGGRRSRSRASQHRILEESSEVNDNDGDDEEGDTTFAASTTKKSQPVATAAVKGKRGRKRKLPQEKVIAPPPTEVDLTEDFESTEQPEMMEVDMAAQDSSSTTEPNTTLESSQQMLARGRKKKKKKLPSTRLDFSQKAPTVPRGMNDPSPEVDATGKSKKKKKAFIPTRLSLRGRRSMYENSELNDVQASLENASDVAAAAADEYFQCKQCTYLGQKIIHHYVNEHNGTEIPYATFPEKEWSVLSIHGPAEDFSKHHAVDSSLLTDLSWIPTRHNLMTPTPCKLCPYSSCKRSELMEHVMLHAMPANCKYRCNLCSQTESNFFDILDHVTGHTGEYRYHCNYCNFRVSSRTGIKQHMSSLHESQDVLFYSTSLPDVDQLWIYGFVCETCRFVQMNEERLQRHLTTDENCESYLKINLISAIHEDSSGEVNSARKNQAAILPAEKNKGVFLCLNVEEETGSNKRENESDFISKTLRGHGTSTAFIQNLAEKLTQVEVEDVPVKSASNFVAIKEEPRSDETVVSQNEVRQRINTIGPRSSCQGVDGVEALSEQQGAAAETAVQEPQATVNFMEYWKSNTWLETTISKLSDKLGNAISNPSSPSADVTPEDHIDAEDSTDYDQEESCSDSSSDSSDASDDSDDQESVSASSDTNGVVKQEVAELNTTNGAEACTEEANASGFLQIESVVSLITVDEGDCLDPIQSKTLVSNVMIRKREITFPFPIPHDRPAFAAELKEKQIYERMLNRDRIKNFYKCMAFRCMFSSPSAKNFMDHLHWHNKQYLSPSNSIPVQQFKGKTASEGAEIDEDSEEIMVPDFCLCSYCPVGFELPEQLVEHVNGIHGDSTFQCSACFFRARLPKLVAVHVIVAHNNNNHAHTLNCQRAVPDLPLKVIESPQVGILDVPKYRCSVTECHFTCIHRSSFVAHMSMCHPGKRACECKECNKTITCSNKDCTELFVHMNKHQLGFFQCSFCQWGTDLPTDILLHLCLVHPSLHGRTLIRSPHFADGADSKKWLIKFWAPSLPHSYRPLKIDLDERYKELFSQVQVIESTLGAGEDIFDNNPVNSNSSSGEQQPTADKQPTVQEQIDAQEFHGFGDEEKEQAKGQSTVCIVLDDIDDSNSADGPQENEDASALLNGQEEEEQQFGLFGRELYKCGNLGCDETAESVSSFKEHLLVCDLARDSRLLTCSHCGKNLKQVAHLIDHLRSHGVKRFSCSLCNFRAVQMSFVKTHMKKVHRVTLADEVSIGPGPGPALPENILFSLYPREMAIKLKSSRTRAGSNRNNNRIFTFKEAGTIPMKSILSYSVMCAHCGYASKVRANMLRHLALHETRMESTNGGGTSSEGEEIIPRVVVPDQAPVNPVPHLESPSKEKMFDKMANLAYSSHATDGKIATKASKMGNSTQGASKDDSVAVDGSTNLPSSSSALSLQPAFVPDHKRYVCGFKDCGHLTINDNLLKHHMQTLHKKGVFSCPHCRLETANDLSLDGFRNHLKIHGPKLFKCGHCDFFHWQLHEIESHLTEKHPNRTPWQFVIREPSDTEVKRLQNSSKSPGKNAANLQSLPWNCALCKHVTASLIDVAVHAENVHGVKSQFKCALCPVRCNIRSELDRHFSVKHPNQEVQILTLFYRVESQEGDKHVESEIESAPINVQPLWKKNEPRPRHIRGILLEENETKRFNPVPSAGEIAGVAPKPSKTNKSTVTGASIQQQPEADPVYGSYGSPVDGLLTCPMCPNYRVSYGRDLKNHLYRELDYNRFFCSICDVGACSRIQAQKHIEKQHPNESTNAYIKEITSNQALEDWVDKVIATQSIVLKATKSTLPKAKKTLSSPITSPTNSPTKLTALGPKKGKKASETITVPDSSSYEKPKSIVIEVESQKIESSSIYNCFACQFISDSELLLENHVVATHGRETISMCLQCGFKFTTHQSMMNHQKKTNHTKVNSSSLQLASDADSVERVQQPLPIEKQDNESAAVKTKKSLPYWCKYCSVRTPSEHGINLHWESKHASSNLPFDYGFDQSSGETTVKILFKCLYCGFQDKLEEVKEHSKNLHPHNSPKISRMASKVRSHNNSTGTVDSGSSTLEPPAKKIRQDLDAKMISNPINSSSSSGVKAAKTLKQGGGVAGSAQTVFVVAPPTPPTYTCVCCFAKFTNETAVIRHHAAHAPDVPLRYTCLDTSKTNAVSTSMVPIKPELAVMEIRFSCPVCVPNKHFTSLTNAQSHVAEHKQVWKCGHCPILFGSPEQSLVHWKNVHPGLQGRLESIDSHQILERLTKEIKLIRIQINTKNFFKPTQPADSSSKNILEGSAEKSDRLPATNQPNIRNSTGARKSTSANVFLKENLKSEPLSSDVSIDSHRDPPSSSSST